MRDYGLLRKRRADGLSRHPARHSRKTHQRAETCASLEGSARRIARPATTPSKRVANERSETGRHRRTRRLALPCRKAACGLALADGRERSDTGGHGSGVTPVIVHWRRTEFLGDRRPSNGGSWLRSRMKRRPVGNAYRMPHTRAPLPTHSTRRSTDAKRTDPNHERRGLAVRDVRRAAVLADALVESGLLCVDDRFSFG